MEDIKLTIEDIKKAVPFADGYQMFLEKINTPEPRKWELEYFIGHHAEYSLFLQRVIEGISEHSDFFIEQTSKTIDVTWYMHPTKPGHKERFICSSIDQAKTQAIKYILDKL